MPKRPGYKRRPNDPNTTTGGGRKPQKLHDSRNKKNKKHTHKKEEDNIITMLHLHDAVSRWRTREKEREISITCWAGLLSGFSRVLGQKMKSQRGGGEANEDD